MPALLVAPGSSVSASSSARCASASSSRDRQQRVQLVLDQRRLLGLGRGVQLLPRRRVGMQRDDAEDRLAQRRGHRRRIGGLRRVAATRFGDHRRVAERAERADQVAAQDRHRIGLARPARSSRRARTPAPAARSRTCGSFARRAASPRVVRVEAGEARRRSRPRSADRRRPAWPRPGRGSPRPAAGPAMPSAQVSASRPSWSIGVELGEAVARSRANCAGAYSVR